MYKLTFTYKGVKGMVKREELPTKEDLERYFEQIKEMWKEQQEKNSPR